MALTRKAHQLISDHFKGRHKDQAIDATCGNGHDTEFLLNCGFAAVTAFDIQSAAIEATKNRLNGDALDRVSLVLDGHQEMEKYVANKVDCIVFNLGYLPHADKTITTIADTSLQALEASTRVLTADGLISLLCYPGHEAGRIETDMIQSWLKSLTVEWNIETHLSRSPKPDAPILYTLTRKT